MSTRRLLGESLTSAGVVDGVIQDDWDQIIKICKAGRAQDFYSVGDMKALSFGSEGTINMQIADFNKDIKADLSGTANTTWIGKECLKTAQKGKQQRVGGGWRTSDLRTYCNQTLLDLLPSVVKNGLTKVRKFGVNYCNWDAFLKYAIDIADDYIWLLSLEECLTKTYYSGSLRYSLYQNGIGSFIKVPVDQSSAQSWWLRAYGEGSSNTIDAQYAISGSGGLDDQIQPYFYSYYLCPCFCL